MSTHIEHMIINNQRNAMSTDVYHNLFIILPTYHSKPNLSHSFNTYSITGAAKTPSTAFCLLLRLMTLRCSEKQMKLMLDHVDSPFIRCIGFLYLRYTAEPTIIWEWLQPYLYDEDPVKIEMNVKAGESTVGAFVRGILMDLEYHGTRLPRLPVAIERDIKVKLLQEEQIEQRAQRNLKDDKMMGYFERVGAKVQAMYGDEENPVTWYDAVVDRVVKKDDVSGVEFYRSKFLVTFTEYGNSALVSVGEMDMPGVDHSVQPLARRDDGRGSNDRYESRGYDDRDRDRGRGRRDGWNHERRDDGRGRDFEQGGGGYRDGQRYSSSRGYDGDHRSREDHHRERSRSRDRALPNERELMQEVLRREQKTATGSGRGYASRPQTFRSVESNRGHASTDEFPRRERDRPVEHYKSEKVDNSIVQEEARPTPKQKTPEELAAIAEKKRKLAATYG